MTIIVTPNDNKNINTQCMHTGLSATLKDKEGLGLRLAFFTIYTVPLFMFLMSRASNIMQINTIAHW